MQPDDTCGGVVSPGGRTAVASAIRAAIAVAVLATTARGHQDPPIAPTAGDDPAGVMRFLITDEAGAAIPGRLTFVRADGAHARLFPNIGAAPHDLAVRRNVIYTLSGEGRVTVPAGIYTVHASRGLEWSIDSTRVKIRNGREVSWTASLSHEIDTEGWIGADLHLHTLTHSGHGDSGMNERVISLIGEGVEFAVASDHNHHTDYLPVIERLGAAEAMTAITGNEISTPIGHFNAYPLDPDDDPVEHRLGDATALFSLVRAQKNPFGITPVIQVNHPRWSGIDYFGCTGVDPITSVPHGPSYSPDFDAIEILNHNEAWGYHDAEMLEHRLRGPAEHWALRDWFNMLNRGSRVTAVGNSDSHHVIKVVAGFPRNFVVCSTDDPGAIDPREVAAAIRERRSFTTTGPFLEFDVDGTPMGGQVAADGGSVDVRFRVQAASWIDCDRAKIIVNGDTFRTIDVPPTREPFRIEATIPIATMHDCWITIIVEGDDALAPIVIGDRRPARPLAIANPIWVDAEGDGVWQTPIDRAKAAVATASSAESLAAMLDGRPPVERGLLVIAAAEDAAIGPTIVMRGLADDDRGVRLVATRAAMRSGDASLAPALRSLLQDETIDPYLATACLTALATVDGDRMADHVMVAIERYGLATLSRYQEELIPVLPGRFVSTWKTLGYFPCDSTAALGRHDYGPESDADTARTYATKQQGDAAWREGFTRRNGFLDLGSIDPRPKMHERAIAYAQTWVHAPTSRGVQYMLGADDACQLYLNDRLVRQHAGGQAAGPLDLVDTLDLDAGWNRVLIKVANERHGFGLYFRFFDDAVTFAAEPPQGGS